MLPGIDAEELARVQATTKLIMAEVTVDQGSGVLTLKLSSTDDNARTYIPMLLHQFVQALGEQLRVFYAIETDIS